MRSGGIDNASVGWSAFGLAIDGIPKKAWVFKPSDPKDNAAVHAEEKYDWLRRVLFIAKPDIVAVEESNVFSHKKAIRAIARHEGIALLAAKKSGAAVINPGVSQARSIVFKGHRPPGKAGALSKEDAWKLFQKLFPDVKLLAKTSGGLDQMDSLVLALSALTIMERR